MGIKTTITPRGKTGTPEIGSLWQDEDGDIYVLVKTGGKFSTLQVDDLSAHWYSSEKDPKTAVSGLVQFHGKVVIELGGGE